MMLQSSLRAPQVPPEPNADSGSRGDTELGMDRPCGGRYQTMHAN